MARISFFVDHEPVAQPRHQVKGKCRWIKPPKGMKEHPIHLFKQMVQLRAREATSEALEGPLQIQLIFWLPGTKKQENEFCTKGGDWDNLVKADERLVVVEL